jgi:methyltransferase (TIGR00027 family)
VKKMSENSAQNLNGVAETLLLPLYVRAIESQRPDALIKDERAVALVEKNRFDFSRIKQAKHDQESFVAIVLRNRKIDNYAHEFINHYPEAVVVHIGCGLDTRFERVDNGKVVWYDLDLPEVINLRREYIGDQGGRYHFLAYSMFDDAWIKEVSAYYQRPFLFLIEGVLMYFEEEQVMTLVRKLREHFPGSKLVFDAFSPFFAWANNRRVSRTGFGSRCHWALKDVKDLEGWGNGIRLLNAWYPFCSNEPRLKYIHWVRHVPFLAKTIGVFSYRLGELTA